MTDRTNDAAGDRPLQFDAAEPTGSSEPLACTSCGARIRGSYHEANGAVVCSGCRQAIERRLRGGSSIGRFSRALALGAGAALLGAAVYFGIALATGYELGLIAIVVGWLVGRAVNAGSRGRGGWRYQTLAIALTYSAIVVTYMPAAMERSMGIDFAAMTDSLAADSMASDPLVDESDEETAESVVLAVAAPDDATGDAGAQGEQASIPAALAVALGLAFMFVLAWAEPILQGPANLMGLVIIAIGLYQAWLQNRPVEMTITGPYALGATRPTGAP